VRILRLRAGVLAALCMLSFPAGAQDFPARPITLIVPFAAGGSSDVNARLVTEYMSQDLGQRFIIENIPGAGGLSALTRLTQSPPDGYTIAIGNSGTNTAVYLFNPEVKFTHEDFAPIGLFTRSSAVVVIKKDSPANTLAEFIALAKANPGKVTIGHSGLGSQNYLFCKTFIQAAGINVTMVGYRGGGPALNDLVGGQIDGLCDSSSSASQAILGGLVKGVALASSTRLPSQPRPRRVCRTFRVRGGMRCSRRRIHLRRSLQGSIPHCARQSPMPTIRSGWMRSVHMSCRTARSHPVISRSTCRVKSRSSRA
jgi:tripartite-type tricarboxylate transporter receptor subunit TctC